MWWRHRYRDLYRDFVTTQSGNITPQPLGPGDPQRLGRFDILGKVGEGGQGIVYLGRGTGPGEERVAVKVLRSSVDGTALQRLGQELAAAHQVQPFVTADIIEASTEGEWRYIVSEFIDGPSLQDRVVASGPLVAGELQRLAVGTATALAAIHGAGVVHRDFKPANVLLGPDGPRVVDFGIAKLSDASTFTSGVIGTPSYISPEQLAGARPTSAVDIFAWAATMLFAATGRMAFGGDTVAVVMHRVLYEEPDLTGVPVSLLPVLKECLAKDPLRRPSARDLLLRFVSPQPQVGVTSLDGSGPAGGFVPGGVTGPGSTFPVSVGGAGPTTGPRHAPAPAPVPSPGGRRGRGPLMAVGGGAVVVIVAIVGTILLTRGSPPTHVASSSGDSSPGVSSSGVSSPGTASASTVPTNSTSQAPGANSAATGAVIPAAFAGTWSGTASMSSDVDPSIGIDNAISFTMNSGGTTASEVNQDCRNTLTLTRATSTVLTFSEPQQSDCQAGTVTFTLASDGTHLAYRWTAPGAQNTATLSKKGA